MLVLGMTSMGSTFTSVRSLRYVIYPVQVGFAHLCLSQDAGMVHVLQIPPLLGTWPCLRDRNLSVHVYHGLTR